MTYMPMSDQQTNHSSNPISPYLQIMRMDRPVGVFLLLWPTLWALWLAADGQPDPNIVLIFIAGTFTMRAAGCVINDYADQDFDGHVERTRNRALATGRINSGQALITFVLLLLVAFFLVIQLNTETIKLSFFAVLIAAAYPFAKRFTHLPQLVLGAAFSWGIPMAYTAIIGHTNWQTWALFVANFFWIVAYDTWYAMADREDDLIIGVKSTAILFGRFDLLIIGLLQIASLQTLVWVGWQSDIGWHFYLGIAVATIFAVYQQIICKQREPIQCFKAFLNNNWLGAVVFAGILLGTLNPTI